MKYGVQMASSAITYISSFIQTGSGIQKLIWGGGILTGTQHGDHISLL
jgi:hypothetical protein